MISPLPAISLILPLFSGFSKKSSTVSRKSNFKHYEGATLEWEPMTERDVPGHVCMSPNHCLFDVRNDNADKSESKHVCVAQNGCLYNH